MAELRYFSFSRVSSDSKCERARYLGSEWGGSGLQPVKDGFDLTYGDIIHQNLECLAKVGSIDYSSARAETLKAALDFGHPLFVARDWSALAEGHLRGFVKAVWPRWMKEYDILETEKMRSWDIIQHSDYHLNNLAIVQKEIDKQINQGAYSAANILQETFDIYRFRYRQDILLQSKFNGEKIYVDYKTTSDDSPKWIASWAKHPQLHSSAYAMKQQGIEVDQILIQGFNKGWKDKKTGAPGSIFSKGWVNRQYSMSPQYSYTYQRGKGWEAFSVAEEFDDLSEWVANMPSEILTAQFPQTGPIIPRDDIGEVFFRQQLIREAEIAEAVSNLQHVSDEAEMTSILDSAFRQDFEKCQPSFGYECPFKNLCWIPSVSKDPLGSGEYVRRPQLFEDGK